ncbi:Type II secretion system protein GspC, N-terminal [Oxalobacteraceae bacterium]
MNYLKVWKERLPNTVSFLFFIGVWVSLSFWLQQWLSPPVQPMQLFPMAEKSIPPLSSAANLFGGSEQSSMLANVQLNGVIRSNSSKDSIVIIATDGGPSRALRLNSEIMPGIVVKSINARSVILSGNGTEREITLPAFASQDGIVPDTAGLTPQNNANGYRRAPITARAPSRPSAAVPVAATAGSAGASTSETNTSGVAGQAATTVPLQAPQIVPPTDANRR